MRSARRSSIRYGANGLRQVFKEASIARAASCSRAPGVTEEEFRSKLSPATCAKCRPAAPSRREDTPTDTNKVIAARTGPRGTVGVLDPTAEASGPAAPAAGSLLRSTSMASDGAFASPPRGRLGACASVGVRSRMGRHLERLATITPGRRREVTSRTPATSSTSRRKFETSPFRDNIYQLAQNNHEVLRSTDSANTESSLRVRPVRPRGASL